MDEATNDQFTKYLLRLVERSKKEAGYNPKTFTQMLSESGGYRTTLTLLNPELRRPSEGFTRLFEKNRLDLSLEAACLEPKWADYFEEQYLEEARRRLTEAGYDFGANAILRRPWSKQECELAVDDYFDMLVRQMNGESLNKAKHIEVLIPKLDRRNANSIGMKYSNISAILVEHGIPHLSGHNPLGNYQVTLEEVVERYVEMSGNFVKQIFEILDQVPPPVTVAEDFGKYFESAPKSGGSSKQRSSRTFRPKKLEFTALSARELANKKLGNAGEAFVLGIEKQRLLSAGRGDLANSVKWVSRDEGDGAGYDILSFEPNGEKKFIEVKTTNGGAKMPFVLTKNEYEFSKTKPTHFQIYRVHSFFKDPKVFILTTEILQDAVLEPATYKVWL